MLNTIEWTNVSRPLIQKHTIRKGLESGMDWYLNFFKFKIKPFE